MKKYLIAILGITFFALPITAAQHSEHKHGKIQSSSVTESEQKTTPENVKVLYKCPMHPEETSTEPGRCPKCGMKMTEVSKAVSYRCPMHPDVVSDKAGKCPKCNKTMVPERFEGSQDYK